MPNNWQEEARRAAVRHGLDPTLFVRQIGAESSFNPAARSPAGALGIAQIMPTTARSWGVDPMNPRAALDAAASHMKTYVRQFGSYADALRAYNAGPGAVQKSHGFAETNNYVRSIIGGSGGGGGGGGGARRAVGGPGGAARSVTRTQTPGVDNRAARAQLVQSFLGQKGSDPVDFALGIRALKDVAPTTTTTSRGGRGGGPGRGTIGARGEPPVQGSEIKELIFNDGGKGYGIKNGVDVDGASVYSAVWAGHANHVHVAASPQTVVALGRYAQRMGLHVGENPHFGGVDSGAHVPNSYHNTGRAIDVSGDPAKMAAFARYVRHYSHGR